MISKCVICNSDFAKYSSANTCSTKCKFLDGIEKNENGCWIWKRSTGGQYGKMRIGNKSVSTHRIAYEIFKGEIENGKCVCHKCDQPLCCSPDHLFLATQSENIKDCISKKRKSVGEKNHLSKFSDIQILEMRKLRNEGFTYERLCRIFNCAFSHVYNVVKNKVRK